MRLNGLVEGVIRRRWGVLFGCLLVSLLAGWSLSRATFASSLGRLFLGENPTYEEYLRLSARFGSDMVIAVGVEDPLVLTPAGQERLARVIAALRELPDVDAVQSVLDARRLEPGPLGPRVVRYADEAAQRDPAEVLASLAEHPLYGGALVDREGTSHAVFVQMVADPDRPAEETPGIVDGVLDAFRGEYPDAILHASGLPTLTAEVLRQTTSAVLITTPLVGAVLLLTVWLLFGRLWPAALSLGIATVAVLWTMGLAVAIDPQIHILMAAVPGVILIISFSDVVHLCSTYLLELEAGLEKERAVVTACSEVGKACLFTSITTCVGFLCLSLVPTPAFRVLGVVLGLGVGVALMLAVTLTPIVFSLVPAPRALRDGTTAGAQAALDHLLARLHRISTGRPRLVVAAFLLLVAVAGPLAWQMEIETDFSTRLQPGNRTRDDHEWLAARYRGTNLIHVYAKVAPQRLRDPAWYDALAEFHDAVAALPRVDGVVSLVDVVREVQGALPTPAGAPTPAGLLTLMLGSGGPGEEMLARLVDRDEGYVRLLVHVNDHGMRTSGEVARRIQGLASERLSDEPLVVTGLTALLGDFLDEIVAGQRDGLLVSCVTIALLMIVGLGSWRVGLISMGPNLIPLCVLVAMLSLLWGYVDSDAISLTFVALGIGVDDTIHFLTRLRLESQRAETHAEALTRTQTLSGRAILMTTIILALGFLPFLLSDYFLMRMFGSMLPLALVVALLADLLLVPALVQLGWMRFPLRPTSPAAGSGPNPPAQTTPR